MALRVVEDRPALERFLRRDSALRVYELGDLDDFFWPHTTYYGWWQGGAIQQVALLYRGASVPTLVAQAEPSRRAGMTALLAALAGELPPRVYAHLGPGLAASLGRRYHLDAHGAHQKMGLAEPDALGELDDAGVEPLGPADRGAIEALYAEAYPDHWFSARMLETGQYVGIRSAAGLTCVAGVHVYSEQYRVAALGNVATHPSARGHRLAARACAALCRRLLRRVEHIGLNVRADNLPAIRCYQRIGFVEIARYGEWKLTQR